MYCLMKIGDEPPSLIDNGVRTYLRASLKQCHLYKENYFNILINICVFIGFILILGTLLVYRYKGKLSPEEKLQKDKDTEQYIMSKIKNYQQDKLYAQQKLITGLPHWETEYDIITKKNYQ